MKVDENSLQKLVAAGQRRTASFCGERIEKRFRNVNLSKRMKAKMN